MAQSPEWVPTNVDADVPCAARIYDYLLGGSHNFAGDREVAKTVLQAQPNGRRIASPSLRTACGSAWMSALHSPVW